MPYDRAIAEQLLRDVLQRLEVSADKYKDAYVLNDIAREIDEEILDLLGWAAMEAMRMRETLQKMIYHVDRIYWERFLANQTQEFLFRLLHEASKEVGRRKILVPEVEILNLQKEISGVSSYVRKMTGSVIGHSG